MVRADIYKCIIYAVVRHMNGLQFPVQEILAFLNIPAWYGVLEVLEVIIFCSDVKSVFGYGQYAQSWGKSSFVLITYFIFGIIIFGR